MDDKRSRNQWTMEEEGRSCHSINVTLHLDHVFRLKQTTADPDSTWPWCGQQWYMYNPDGSQAFYDNGEPRINRIQVPCDEWNGQLWQDNSPTQFPIRYPTTAFYMGDVGRPTIIPTDYPTYSG